MPNNHVDDLAEMDAADGNTLAQKEQQIEDLKDELRLAQKNNALLIADKSADTKELY